MSFRFDESLIEDAFVFGVSGLGVLADDIPSTGLDGPPPLYNDLVFPDDEGAEVRALITTWPTDGDLVMDENSSFEFSNAPEGVYFFEYQPYKNGVAVGSPKRVDMSIGMQDSTLSGDAAAIASASGNLSTNPGLHGDAAARASATGALKTGAGLRADAKAQAGASAMLAGSGPAAALSADAQAQAGGSASLGAGAGLSADAGAEAGGAGTLDDEGGKSAVRRASLAHVSTAKKKRKKSSWSQVIGEITASAKKSDTAEIEVSTPEERRAAIDEMLANEGISIEAPPSVQIRNTDEQDLMFILQFIARM